jgi:hypothetical protein
MAGRLKSITFKPCEETGQLDLTLRDLAMVNILVGANGAGKSRVLRSIEQAKGHYESHTKSEFLLVDPPITVISTLAIPKAVEETPHTRGQASMERYRQAVDELSIDGKLTKHAIKIQKPAPLGAKHRVIEEEVEEYRYNDIPIARGDSAIDTKSFFSGGTTRLANIIEEIEGLRGELHRQSNTSPESVAFLVVVEEIETALHPSAHKMVLSKLVELVRSLMFLTGPGPAGFSYLLRRPQKVGSVETMELKDAVQIFVSTHSPFVVAAAAEYDPAEVKVYLLKDGKTRSVKDEPGGEHGYGGMESLFAANWLLGASQRDYIPSKIILAEESVQKFVKTAAKTLGCSLTSYQASTTGDSKTQSTAKTLVELARSHLDFGKTQPWKSVLSFQVHVLLDSKPSDSEQVTWDRLKQDFGDAISIIVLSESEFEELHPSELVAKFLTDKGDPHWHSGKFKEYARNLPHIAELKTSNDKAGAIGKLKCELATYVAERMDLNTLQQNYSKLFPIVVGRERA